MSSVDNSAKTSESEDDPLLNGLEYGSEDPNDSSVTVGLTLQVATEIREPEW